MYLGWRPGTKNNSNLGMFITAVFLKFDNVFSKFENMLSNFDNAFPNFDNVLTNFDKVFFKML